MLISVCSSVHPIGSICNVLPSDSTQRKHFIAIRALREQSSISIAIIVVQSEPRNLRLVIVMLHVKSFGVNHKMSVIQGIITAKRHTGDEG